MEKLILVKLSYINERINELELRYDKFLKENDEFEKKTLKLANAKLVEEIIETATKVNNILLEKKNKYASTYYESFYRLIDVFNLDRIFIKEIAKTTSIRNKTVHEYKNVDIDEILEKEIKNILNLYKRYICEIKELIKLK